MDAAEMEFVFTSENQAIVEKRLAQGSVVISKLLIHPIKVGYVFLHCALAPALSCRRGRVAAERA